MLKKIMIILSFNAYQITFSNDQIPEKSTCFRHILAKDESNESKISLDIHIQMTGDAALGQALRTAINLSKAADHCPIVISYDTEKTAYVVAIPPADKNDVCKIGILTLKALSFSEADHNKLVLFKTENGKLIGVRSISQEESDPSRLTALN